MARSTFSKEKARIDISYEAVISGIVCDFLARNMELTGHILINTQNIKIRLSEQMIMKDLEPA